MSTSGEASQPTEFAEVVAKKARFQISENVKRNAKGTVRTAVDALGVVAQATQDVPYLGVVSGALTAVLKIYNEVDTYKSEWKAAAAVSQKIKEIIDEAHAKCKQRVDRHGESLPVVVLEPLSKLEESLVKTVETLNACMPAPTARKGSIRFRRILNVAREVLNRGDLADSVKQCRVDMQTTLDLFHTRLHIDNALTLQYLVDLLEQRETKPPHLTIVSASISLPPAPAIFHGRAKEVDHAVDLIVRQAPGRVAILGPGGIGKTSIALTVLHHSEVIELYADQRYFMSCEAVTTAQGIMHELLKVFGLVHDTQSGISPQDMLFSHLHTLSTGILCLDNLETPWDADIQAVEELLSRISALAHIALLITTRGGDRPKQISWTRPFLPPIEPLTLDSALSAWDAICDSHDENTVKLIQTVDCVPLAVTLLAHLAETESSKTLCSRWERERTELLRVRGPDTRLNSVDISVQLSLEGFRLRSDEETMQFFIVLCTLPQGIPEARIKAFADAFVEQLPNLSRCIAALKQCSLAYSSQDGFLRVLSPVRSFMQSSHRITGPLIECLFNHYHAFINFKSDKDNVQRAYAIEHIRPEQENIASILDICLDHEHCDPRNTVQAVVLFANLHLSLGHDKVHFLSLTSKAIVIAARKSASIATSTSAELWKHQAAYLDYTFRKEDALSAYLNAHDLFISIGDRRGEARCLAEMGRLNLELVRYTEAERLSLSAIRLCEIIGDHQDHNYALGTLATVYLTWKQVDKAEEVLNTSLALSRSINDRYNEAWTRKQYASIFCIQGRRQDEEATLQTALDLFSMIDNKMGKASTLRALGIYYMGYGQLDRAESVLRASLAISTDVGDRAGQARALNRLGRLYVMCRQFERARSAILSALDILAYMSDAYCHASAHYTLGAVHEACGEVEGAKRCYEAALVLYEQAQEPDDVVKSKMALERLHT